MNSDLVNPYRVVQHHLDEFVRQFRWALTSRKLFEWVQAAHVEGLADIQRAARFFYLQKLCFGAKLEGQTFGVATTSTQALNLLRIEEELSAAHLRLSQVVIEHLDWAKCIERYDRPSTERLTHQCGLRVDEPPPPAWRLERRGCWLPGVHQL